MNLVQVLILGLVEGITEFLPVSSTAHLIITSKFLNIPQTDFLKFFEVFIQSGAILAVIFLYFKYLLKNPRLIKNIVISFLPTAVVGFFSHRIIKDIFFESFNLIVGSLFFVGLLFIVFELLVRNKKIKLEKSINQLNIYQAVMIGLVQSLAVVPGVSRAGAVMLGMMVLGYKRDESAVYSFLLAVPTILAAGLFDLYKSKEILLSSQNNIWVLAFGFITSFIFAYLSIKWLINFLKNNTLMIFGIYRITIALLLFML